MKSSDDDLARGMRRGTWRGTIVAVLAGAAVVTAVFVLLIARPNDVTPPGTADRTRPSPTASAQPSQAPGSGTDSESPPPSDASPDSVETSASPAATETPPVDRVGLLVVGDDEDLNDSEEALLEHLEGKGSQISLAEDDDAPEVDHDRFPLIIISKTVESKLVADAFKDARGGVIFWEDNAQSLQMMATIDDSEQTHTGWHSRASEVEMHDGAPPELTAGLRGPVEFLKEGGEITYAPVDADGTSTLADDAIRIARMVGTAEWSIYAYERGARLADGSGSAGRRVYFGLYDDTFRLLTDDGLALFDAALEWAADD